jgi:CBS domain containing-hemolysin-like protein
MDNSTANIIIWLIVLILLSGFFSATETAYSSLNKIKLKNLANNENNKRAEDTLALSENYSKLITTILVGNNVVNIVATALATLLFTGLYGKDLGVTISTVVMTLLVLIFGEITPKNIAKESPEKYAMAVYPVFRLLVMFLTPINFIFEQWKKLLKLVFHFEGDDSLSSDELVTIVEEAQNDGDLNEHESDLIINAIEFGESEVKEIFTPRVDVIAIDINMTNEEIEKVFRENGYSRIPVFENDIDNIIGVLHDKDFYYLNYNNKDIPIKSVIKNVQFTTAHVLIYNLLRQLQANKMHMAVVLDEYGGTAGIITMEDILEELVGEIYDEHDEIVQYFTKSEDNVYRVKCEVDVEDFFDYFDMRLHEELDVVTVSGWIISELKKIPDINDTFVYENLYMTITKVSKKKIIEIEVFVEELKGYNETGKH